MRHALARAQQRGVDRTDARMLLLHALGRPVHARAWLFAHDDEPLPPQAAADFDALCGRRLDG